MGALKSIGSGRVVRLRSRHLIGRSEQENDLWLNEPHVSGCHAELCWSRGLQRWSLIDRHSKNGTLVDGVPLASGARHELRRGMVITFGTGGSTWGLVSSEPPTSFASCEQDGTEVGSSEGVLELPADGAPQVAVYRVGSGWVAEVASGANPIRDREGLVVKGQRWQVHLPSHLASTAAAKDATWSVESLTLELRVSLDEEDIDLRLHQNGAMLELRHRSHHALVLALCRERMADSSQPLPARAHGWMDRDLLLEALRVSPTTLDQYVHRTRKQFADAHVGGSRGIIERRRGSGSLRIGVSNLILSPL